MLILDGDGLQMYKIGDKLVFGKCTCGDDLRDGHTYEVLATKGQLFMFMDSSNQKRVRNMNSKCFKKVE